jgi:hypothetical protein
MVVYGIGRALAPALYNMVQMCAHGSYNCSGQTKGSRLALALNNWAYHQVFCT